MKIFNLYFMWLHRSLLELYLYLNGGLSSSLKSRIPVQMRKEYQRWDQFPLNFYILFLWKILKLINFFRQSSALKWWFWTETLLTFSFQKSLSLSFRPNYFTTKQENQIPRSKPQKNERYKKTKIHLIYPGKTPLVNL